MPDNPVLSWSFRNRILLGGKKLRSDNEQQLLYESGNIRVALMTLLAANFTEADSLILRGDGFSSSDEAFAAGRLWRQYVTVAFAVGRLGADFDPLPHTSFSHDDRPRDLAAPGLVIFPIKQFDFRTEGWASATVYRPIERFLEHDLPSIITALPNGLSDRTDLELAFRMFHLALQSDNVDIQYILLVTALEALIPDKKPDKDDSDLIDAFDKLIEFAREPDRFSSKLRDKIISTLTYQKQESIIGFGAKLAEDKLTGRQYDGLSPGEYFRRAYSRRSSLVHGNLSKGNPIDRALIFRDLDTLRQFVADLLAAEAGYPDPNQPPSSTAATDGEANSPSG